MIEMKAKAYAIDTRLKLGLQSTDYIDVYKAVATLKIGCIKRVLESKISGATIKAGDNLCMILVNSSKTLGHQNFTVAHEIYHCLYDDGIQNRACVVELFAKKPQAEQIAELYAVHLLMPEDGILNQLKLRNKIDIGLGVSDVVHLEQYFSVSRLAMCWRLLKMGLITKEESKLFSQNVIMAAKKLGKNTELYEPTNDNIILSDYVEKADEALEKGLITPARYEEILFDVRLFDTTDEDEL